ncbi:MAG: GGDEF domain protein [Comamonadaceae bacterium]|nr:MAG: GGDEF domain protein [Comamonadaceae bacterium]
MPVTGSLFKKYALFFGALVGGSLLISGLLDVAFSYQDNKQALIRLQQEKARSAADRIGQHLFDLEQKISSTVAVPNGLSNLDQRMVEIQLLRRTAAIREIALLDPQGIEVLRVSPFNADVLRSGRDRSGEAAFQQVKSGKPYRSPVYFRDNSLYMTVAMSVGPEASGITVAEIDLQFLLAGITKIKVGDTGHAYAVDTQGRLIAHPNIGLVLKHSSMIDLPQVRAAIQDATQDSGEFVDAIDLDGKQVLTAFGVIPYLGWFVFVEEPISQAFHPLYAQAVRSALLILVGMVATVLACVALVRQMVKPIHALRDGAKLIGRGVFDQPITVHTGDELEELAGEFNRMSSQLHDSYTTLERKVAQRTQELTESERLLRQAQRIAGLGSFTCNLKTGVWTSSEVLDEVLGIDKAYERTAQGWDALVHPDDLPAVKEAFKSAVLDKKKAMDNVLRIIRHHDRAERWVHGLGRVEFAPDGTVQSLHGTIQDITERQQMEDQVRQLAFYDPLTELPNRRLLNDRLNQMLIAGRRTGSYGALMFLDLDNFKPLNDRYGHAVGDRLLIEVAQRLTQCVRKADTVSRFGGDEFVVMLCELSNNRAEATLQAQVVAEKIRASLSELYSLPVRIEGNTLTTIEHRCSVSIGVMVFNCAEAMADHILKGADAAMYQAKDAGRNLVRLYADVAPS